MLTNMRESETFFSARLPEFHGDDGRKSSLSITSRYIDAKDSLSYRVCKANHLMTHDTNSLVEIEAVLYLDGEKYVITKKSPLLIVWGITFGRVEDAIPLFQENLPMFPPETAKALFNGVMFKGVSRYYVAKPPKVIDYSWLESAERTAAEASPYPCNILRFPGSLFQDVGVGKISFMAQTFSLGPLL